MKHLSIAFVLTAMLSACAAGKEVTPVKPAAASPVDSHTSRDSLDWAGVYEGVLPCADCPGIKTRLTLGSDGTFERQTQYLDRETVPRTEVGKFTWHASGNAISLDANGGGQQYAVGEGRLILLNRDGTRPDPQALNRVLTRAAKQAPAGSDLSQMLENHRWTLVSATDSQNRRNDILLPVAEHPFVFSFSGAALNVKGSCNTLRGGYQINAAGQLNVGPMATTMMACESALMKADTALAALLAKPLRIDLVEDTQPQLRLVTTSNETLLLSGQATPEALYGPATLIFLEVAAEPVACSHPLRPETMCLQVRERVFDEQGLMVGSPGPWRPLYENIEGYQHTPGQRNVLRVKRFQRQDAPADASSTVYVLDLIVESEVVTR
jgi:heat shock protein HslJ